MAKRDRESDVRDLQQGAEADKAAASAEETREAPQEDTQAEMKDDGGDVVKMVFPTDVTVIDAGVTHRFKKGVQMVPRHLVDHWYLKASGVESS
jgi:hypothetical protein